MNLSTQHGHWATATTSDEILGMTPSHYRAGIASRIGAPKAVQTVAQACVANALAVAIPCHRVVRKDDGLSGYHWGVERKRALLDKEAHACVHW
jgi:AraC family transcriptional regulator of adaptative response/methylated-DNA-[protein]-cysteine methyltransferase